MHARTTCFVLTTVLAAASASAQPRAGWVVIVATHGPDSSAARQAGATAGQHLEAAGQSVLLGEALDERVSADVSAPFVPLSADENERIEGAPETILRLVAYGDDEQTQRAAAPLLRDFGRRLAAVGREDAQARRLFDICLYVVRSHLHARDPAAARTQMLECLHMVPEVPALQPGASETHPPSVRQLAEAVRTEIRNSGAPFEVSLSGTESACDVRLQGRRVDRRRPIRIVPGRYELQVECGSAAGRVRDLDVAVGGTRVSIDPSLDEALGDRQGLALVYPNGAALSAGLQRHVLSIGRSLGVANVLVVRTDTADALALERYRIEHAGAHRVATARVALSADGRVPPAVDALIAGRSIAVEDSAPTSHRPGPEAMLPDEGGDEDGGSIIGPALLGGAGLLAVGVVLGTWATTGCAMEYPGGGCASEEVMDVPVAAAIGGTGLIAIAGAVIWWLASN